MTCEPWMVVLAFCLGGLAGFFLMAMLVMSSKENDCDNTCAACKGERP